MNETIEMNENIHYARLVKFDIAEKFGDIITMQDIADYFKKEIPEEEDVETIAGVILKHLDRMAEVNDTVEWDDFVLTVIELDGTRIVKIKVQHKPKQEKTEEEKEEQSAEI